MIKSFIQRKLGLCLVIFSIATRIGGEYLGMIFHNKEKKEVPTNWKGPNDTTSVPFNLLGPSFLGVRREVERALRSCGILGKAQKILRL